MSLLRCLVSLCISRNDHQQNKLQLSSGSLYRCQCAVDGRLVTESVM